MKRRMDRSRRRPRRPSSAVQVARPPWRRWRSGGPRRSPARHPAHRSWRLGAACSGRRSAGPAGTERKPAARPPPLASQRCCTGPTGTPPRGAMPCGPRSFRRGTIASRVAAAPGAVGLEHATGRTWTGGSRHRTRAMGAWARRTRLRAGMSAGAGCTNRLGSPREARPRAAVTTRHALPSRGASPPDVGGGGGWSWPCRQPPVTAAAGRTGGGGTNPSPQTTTRGVVSPWGAVAASASCYHCSIRHRRGPRRAVMSMAGVERHGHADPGIWRLCGVDGRCRQYRGRGGTTGEGTHDQAPQACLSGALGVWENRGSLLTHPGRSILDKRHACR
jgi:hypothetical protein